MTSMRPVPDMYLVSQTFAGSFSARFSGGGLSCGSPRPHRYCPTPTKAPHSRGRRAYHCEYG